LTKFTKTVAALSYLIIFVLTMTAAFSVDSNGLPTSAKAERVLTATKPLLLKALHEHGLEYGAPVFIRIFKQSAVLELWLQSSDQRFIHFKDYDICTFSGDLGPKLKEGDNQSPEGFYYVTPSRLNPWSRFHLSFNLGYPNNYDRYHGRTGSALMVHGNCVSIGCYAMTDNNINEIYTLVYAALDAGQPFFRVHAFPFKLEQKNLAKYTNNQWLPFWNNLKQGYDYFNKYKTPPNVNVKNGRYIFN